MVRFGIRFGVLILVGALQVACASMSNMMGTVIPITHPQIQYAMKNKDLDMLKKVCSGEWKVDVQSDRNISCDVVRKAEAEEAAKNASNIPCEQLSETYKNVPKDSEATVTAFGKAFAKCGMYKELFEQVAHWGNSGEGVRILNTVEAAGFPVEQEFVKYAKANPGPKFMNTDTTQYNLDYITKYLIKKGSLGHCATLAAAGKGASEVARVWMLPYFRAAKCKEGLPITHELLLSNTPKYRMWACDALGDYGDATSLKKANTLGANDGYSEVQEQQGSDGRVWGMKVYPVQDACKEAAGKIKLRLD